MLGRLLLLAAVAIGGGVAAGRQALNRKIEKRLPVEIEAAQAQAIAELNKEIGQVISERLSVFTVTLCVKAALVGGFYLLYAEDQLTAAGLKIIGAALIAAFLVRDALRTLPYMAPALRLIRRHRWNARRALKDFIAGVAFERAYAAAMTAMETGPNRWWLAFSKYTAHSISSDVGEAVAEVARTTRFERVKWRAFVAIGLALVMFAAYVFFFTITIGAA